MLLMGDYHTHTIYSRFKHGKNTIEENVQKAVSLGLKEIAITDHGFRHSLFGVRKRKLNKIKAEILRLRKIYDINILFGIESNLISQNGDIDLTKEENDLFDIVLMGYHKSAFPKTFKDLIFFIKSYYANKKGKNTADIIEKNTRAYLLALEKNRINIITHLNYGIKIDVNKIAEKCKETNTLIELNGKRIVFSNDEVKVLINNNSKLIINSDAHSASRVGECNLPTNFAIMNHIPEDLITNLNKLPNFKIKN